MTNLIWVQPGKDDGRVALFEQHPDHPDGEVFVAGPSVQVALTAMVQRKLASGELKEVSAPEKKKEEVRHKSAAEVQAEIDALRSGGGGNEESEVEEEEEEEEAPSPFTRGERPVIKRKGRPPKGS